MILRVDEVPANRRSSRGLPGSSSLFIKPSIGIREDRAFDWGLEAGFKVVGF
jgi:hypothetical protein